MSKSRIAKFGMGLIAAVLMLATAVTANAETFAFAQSLSYGQRNAQVMDLQKFLNMSTDTMVASSGAGSPGMETTYYGPATSAAVLKFQLKHGVVASATSAGAGRFGPATRAKALAVQAGMPTGTLPAGCTSTSGYSPVTGVPCNTSTGSTLPAGCTTTMGYSPITGQPCNGTGGTVTTGPVSAMLATTNPASGVVVAGQATADLAHIAFSGTGTVTSIELQRTGISADTTLSSVYLFEGNTRLTDAASVTTGGVIRFSNPSGLFMVNGSRTISVRADIASNAAGQTVGVRLNNYMVAGQTAAITSTIAGNIMSVATAGNLATATINASNNVVSATIDAGTSNYSIWSGSLTILNRPVWLKGANFRVIGSAESGALQNARLVVDGVQVGAAVASVATNGTLSFDLSTAPVTLNTGAHTVEVRADVVGGADRNFYVSLQNAGDLVITDSQYMVNVAITTGSTGVFSMNNAGTITVRSGTLSLSKDSTFNTTNNVTSGASNVSLARYTLRAYGEAVKVMQVQVRVQLGAGTGLQNVALYANGAQVGTSQNTPDTDETLTFNLGSSLIIPAGTTVPLEVRADLMNSSGTAYTGSVTTTVTIPSSGAQGQTSYAVYPQSPNTLTASSTVVNSGTATANVTKSSSFLTTTVGTNVANARVGSYDITAGTTEGLRVTNLQVTIDQTLVSATAGDVELTDIANLRATVTVTGQAAIQVGPINPQATNNFSTDFTIPAGQKAVVDVYVDVTNATTGETIQTNLLATARGASSNVVLTSGTGIASAQAGQELTVGSGSIINAGGITAISTTATSQRYVLGNTSVEPIIRYSVKPTSGAVTIEEMTFTLGGTANVITALTVTGTNGGSSCSVSVPSGATDVTLVGCSIPVPYTLGGTDLIVTPTINFVGINGISSGTGVTATVDLTAVQYNDGSTSIDADLDNANDDDDLADPSASNAIRPVASLPTLTLTSSNAILANGEMKVGTVTVSASASGNINLETLPITFALGGGALTNNATDVFIVKEGNTTVATTDNAADSAASGAAVITFTNDEVVVAGSSRTFDIYMHIDTVTGGDDTAQISLAPSSGFTWDDINGGGDNLVGTYILNYPTNTVTIQD